MGDKQKKKAFHMFSFFRRKRFRIGGYAALLTVLFIAVVVLVNVGVKAVEDNWALRLDLSYNNLTRLSDQTVSALRSLDEDVTFYVLAAPGSENSSLMEVLDRYRAASRHVRVQVVDPDQNPGLVNAFRSGDASTSFGTNTVIVTNATNSRFKVYSSYDMAEYGYDAQAQQYYVCAYIFERVLTQGLLYVTADRTPVVYALQGHGESDFSSLTAMRSLLEDNNYDVRALDVTDAMPEGGSDVLLVLSPEKDLTPEERDQIMAFLKNGGGMIYVCAVTAPNDLPVFASLLHYYGVAYLDGMVVANQSDATQYYPQQPTFLLPLLNDHAITKPLKSNNKQTIVIPQTRAIALPEMDRADFTVNTILSSKAGSYLVDITETARPSLNKHAGDIEGPFPVAVSVQHAEGENESRIILLGSNSMITAEQMLASFHNGEFLLSALKWAAKDEAVNLSILGKTAQREALTIGSSSEYYTLAALVAGVIPLLALLAGGFVWHRRRRL